jgi:hypothetical protein
MAFSNGNPFQDPLGVSSGEVQALRPGRARKPYGKRLRGRRPRAARSFRACLIPGVMDAARKEASNRAWNQDWEGHCFRDHKVTAPLKHVSQKAGFRESHRFRDHKVTAPLKPYDLQMSPPSAWQFP